jgi:hypothetical protein
MKTMKTTVVAAVWMATAAATIGLAAPAHAGDPPVNLPLTDDVRAQLVNAGAVLTGRCIRVHRFAVREDLLRLRRR